MSTTAHVEAAANLKKSADGGLAVMQAVAKRAGMAMPVADTPAAGTGEPGAGGEGGGDEPDAAAASGAAGEGGEGGDAPAASTDAGTNGEGAAGGEGGEPGAADAEAKAAEAETAALVTSKLKDLPEATRKQVQGVINQRLGQIVAKERQERDTLTTRISELETEAAELRASQGPTTINLPDVHPLMLAASEAEIDKRLGEIDQAEDFVLRFGEEGYPGTDGNPADPAIEPAEIKRRWRELQRERDRVIPAARTALKERATLNAELRKHAPTFFDAKSEDYRAVQAKLKLMPELRRHTNAQALAVQLVLGERAYTALKTKAATPTKPVVEPKKAPRLPGSSPAAAGSSSAPSRGASALPEAMKKLSEATSTKGITGAVEAMLRGG